MNRTAVPPAKPPRKPLGPGRPRNPRGRTNGGGRLIETALDHAPSGLIILDSRCRIRRLTGRAAQLLGVPRAMRTVDLPVRQVLSAGRLTQDDIGRLLDPITSGVTEAREILISLKPPAGEIILTIDIRSLGRLGWVISLQDVTASRQTQDWLLEHASSDPVTGLWTSQHFVLMLRDRLACLQQGAGVSLSVLLIGLRRLSPPNELWGTAIFDALLRLVGQRLAGCLSDGDMAARLPGDQFAAGVVRDAGSQPIEALCAAIVEALSPAFLVNGQLIILGTRIGVAQAPADGVLPEALLDNAGLALLAGGGDVRPGNPSGWRFFDTRLTKLAQARRAFEFDLRNALGRGELELHYQPQVDVFSGRVTGLEALLRWRNPQRGMIPPNAFIPLAEQIGLIGEIGAWVVDEACRQAASWPDHVSVAVNASPLQFETGQFAAIVANSLRNANLAPGRLEIEVTENLLLRDTEAVLGTLAALQGLGVGLVLDDFGTGFASLSQLSRFRFDKIKIDRCFVSPPDPSLQNSAIVRSIASLGRSLGITIIAEGVETARQLDQIKADGCTCVQGYYLSRPVPAADVKATIVRLQSPRPAVAA